MCCVVLSHQHQRKMVYTKIQLTHKARYVLCSVVAPAPVKNGVYQKSMMTNYPGAKKDYVYQKSG